MQQQQKLNIEWQWRAFKALTVDQLEAVYRLRQSVFVVEQNCPYLDVDGNDRFAIHLIGAIRKEGSTTDSTSNKEVVATLRYFPEYSNEHGYASLGRICTAKHIRRAGIGRDLMDEALRYADYNYPNKPIQISAQSYLEKFYQSFRFETISDEYLEDDIPHLSMLRPSTDGR